MARRRDDLRAGFGRVAGDAFARVKLLGTIKEASVTMAAAATLAAEGEVVVTRKSLLFVGASDTYAHIADASEVDLAEGKTNFTIQFYVRFSGLTGDQYLASDFAAPNHLICHVQSGALRFVVRLSGGYQIISGTPSGAGLQASTWYEVSYIWNGSDGEQRIILNGGAYTDEVVAENNSATAGATTTGAANFTLGNAHLAGGSTALSAYLSDVRLWGSALSLAQIQAVRGRVLTGPESASTLAYWPLNGDADDAGPSSGNDLALVNGPTFEAEVPF